MTVSLLVTPSELETAGFWIEGDSFRHLIRVRRLQAGERVRLVDGKGKAMWSVLERVERSQALLRVSEPAQTYSTTAQIGLAVAALRPERASWLVEKATELGVVSIRFFNSKRSPRRYGDATLGRLRRMAVGAMEQSGWAVVPEVDGVFPFEALLPWIAASPRAIVFHPEAERGLAQHGPGSALLVVGPEGGFCEEELSRLTEVDAVVARLGESILRVETAALAASACLLLDCLEST